MSAVVAPLTIVYRQLSEMIPYAGNARTHSRAQLDLLRKSLETYGWTVPMGIAGNKMLAGHGRLHVAIELRDAGIDIPGNPSRDVGPTIDLSHLTEPQQRAYILADNKIAEQAGWNFETLSLEIGALRELNFNLDLTGFGKKELARLRERVNQDTATGTIDSVPETFQVIVDCANDAQQRELLNRMLAEGFACRALTT